MGRRRASKSRRHASAKKGCSEAEATACGREPRHEIFSFARHAGRGDLGCFHERCESSEKVSGKRATFLRELLAHDFRVFEARVAVELPERRERPREHLHNLAEGRGRLQVFRAVDAGSSRVEGGAGEMWEVRRGRCALA